MATVPIGVLTEKLYVTLPGEHLPVLFKDAPVHDDFEAGGAGLSGGFVVHYALLHPDAPGADANGRIHDLRHAFRPAEDIDDVDVYRDLFQRCPGLLSQNLTLIGVHRNDSVATRLHVLGDAVARTRAAAGEAHHRDRFSASKKVLACHRYSQLPSASIFALLRASGGGIRRVSTNPAPRSRYAHAATSRPDARDA